MVTLKEMEPQLTAEEKQELEAAENRKPVFDENCPEMTAEQLKQFRPMRILQTGADRG
jgi:hypothetical protein